MHVLYVFFIRDALVRPISFNLVSANVIHFLGVCLLQNRFQNHAHWQLLFISFHRIMNIVCVDNSWDAFILIQIRKTCKFYCNQSINVILPVMFYNVTVHVGSPNV